MPPRFPLLSQQPVLGIFFLNADRPGKQLRKTIALIMNSSSVIHVLSTYCFNNGIEFEKYC
jgi:hypothetical protein